MDDRDPFVSIDHETVAAIAPLIQQLQHDDLAVSNRAMQALYQLGEPVVAPLMDAFPTFGSTARNHSVFILYNIRTPRAITALISLLDDPDPKLRAHAACYLVKTEDATAIQAAVAPLLADLNEDTIKALGEAGDMRAVEPLLAALRRTKPRFPDFYRRVALARALGQLGDPRAIPVLEQIVNSLIANDERWLSHPVGRSG
jgi:HEAT repeat protein